MPELREVGAEARVVGVAVAVRGDVVAAVVDGVVDDKGGMDWLHSCVCNLILKYLSTIKQIIMMR